MSFEEIGRSARREYQARLEEGEESEGKNSRAGMSSVIVLSDSDEPASPVAGGLGIDGRYPSDVAIDSFDLPEVPFCRELAAGSSTSRGAEDPPDSEENRLEGSSRRRAAVPRRAKATSTEEQAGRRRALAREKALRMVERKASRDARPGECMRFMRVNLDRGVGAIAPRGEVENALRDAGVRVDVTTEPIPNSITWRRNVEEESVDEDGEVRTKRSVRTEEYAIVIWSNREAVRHVAAGTFCASVSNSKGLVPNYNVTLVIYGMEEYFTRRRRQRSDRDPGGEGPECNGRGDRRLDALPIVSRHQLEMCLTEIQIAAKCSSRLVESERELALLVCQYTKSISEIPYKLQKSENQRGKFDWYVMGDNKNTVRVDKDGNGLKRLWQQQLCQFNLSSLETSEAICAVYPSPVRLIEAYKNCTPDEGMNLLKDISIRRAAGPLTTTRKIGPELSKKIYVMFTSQNGDTLLGTET